MSGQPEHLDLSDHAPPEPARRETKLAKTSDTKLQINKPQPPSPRSLRVLVVDDNPDVANTLSMLLRLLGHQVSTAYDGPAGLQLAETVRPEAILLDILLPGMNGYEVARQFRQREDFRAVLLVAVTGLATPEDRQRALDAGFDFHLPKPFDLEDLRRVLATAR